MIFIATALYQEAFPFITNYQLKPKNVLHGFQYFCNEKDTIHLVIMGVGKIQAASAISQLLATIGTTDSDFLIVFGSSAGEKKDLYIGNEIYDLDENRYFYPDVLLDSHTKEIKIVTGSRLYNNDYHFELDHCIYDMESSAVYQAGNKFLGPHQIYFFRFVSDNNAENVNAKMIQDLSSKYASSIIRFIDSIYFEETIEQIDEIENRFITFCRCSLTMEREIHQLFRYARVSGKDYQTYIQNLFEKEISSREEGKKVIYEFRQFLIS